MPINLFVVVLFTVSLSLLLHNVFDALLIDDKIDTARECTANQFVELASLLRTAGGEGHWATGRPSSSISGPSPPHSLTFAIVGECVRLIAGHARVVIPPYPYCWQQFVVVDGRQARGWTREPVLPQECGP